MYRNRLLPLLFLAACPWFASAHAADKPRETIVLWPKGAPARRATSGPEKEQPASRQYHSPHERHQSNPHHLSAGAGQGHRRRRRHLSRRRLQHPGHEPRRQRGRGVAEHARRDRHRAEISCARSQGSGTLRRSLQDVATRLGLVRHRAKELGLKPDRIGVLGFSAGGHLAATLSNNYDKRTYEPLDEADKVSCRPDFTLLIYPAYLVSGPENKLAPEMKVTAETPRTFIVYAEDDPVHVENGLFYYLALKKAKVPAEMHLYPTGGHGYGLRPSKNEVSTWPKRAEEWLRASDIVVPKEVRAMPFAQFDSGHP